MSKRNGFINRELSWLDFNMRVLECAQNKKVHPIGERIKFLSISDSNLNEFISVRFASVLSDIKNQPYKQIVKEIGNTLDYQHQVYRDLKNELKEKHGLEITPFYKLSKSDKQTVISIFRKEIFPLLTPLRIESTDVIPNMGKNESCVAVLISENMNETLNFIVIDNNINKLFMIGKKIIMVEDIIIECLDQLFVNKTITMSGVFSMVKDENVELNHDTSKFILDRMNETLIQRQYGEPIFLRISKAMPKQLENLLIRALNFKIDHIVYYSEIIDFTRFMKFSYLDDKYYYKNFEPMEYEQVAESYSIFSAIDESDILIQHPYETFDTVVKFLEHAATDPSVVGIKQTLYRVSSIDSPIVNSLVNAAQNGKHVSVLIEIKARFDEYRNIQLIHKLSNAGVNVILGMEYIKTHCKFCLVMRRDDNAIKIYSHIGTGNYNEKTATVYTDLSYFTAKQKIGMDLLNVFNIISGVSQPDEKLQKVFYAPVNLRTKLNKLIDREIAFAKKGKRAEIFLKLNSLSDKAIVRKLYMASNAGVKINIICRGVCSIKPTKNISIKSIVGRFLEHSRIYYFYNNKDSEYFISSADLLTRNLDKRVEILLSLKDSEVISKLDDIVKTMLNDTTNSFIMNQKGKYVYIGGKTDSHSMFIQNLKPVVKLAKKKK